MRGARQVGKTHSICAFGKREFVRTAVFDFEMDRHLHRIFAEDLRAEAVLMQLEAAAGMRILPGETLLFFDEIQACPRALMALRYLYEQVPELHVVAAGSLLEFALEAISFPVGRVESAKNYWRSAAARRMAAFTIGRGQKRAAAQKWITCW